MRRPASKTAAAWLAVLGGTLGLHRFALHGMRDTAGWLHVAAAAVGSVGWWRLGERGVDDVVGGVLVLALGASVVAAMGAALAWGLMPDARWNERRHTGAIAGAVVEAASRSSGGLAVLAAVVAAAIGSTTGIAMIAFAAQRAIELSG